MKDIKTIFAGARAATLNDSAVQALVDFFQEIQISASVGSMKAAMRDVDDLTMKLNVDMTADRDTLEMAIRHALTKDQS